MHATFLTALILPGLLLAAPIAGSGEPAAENAAPAEAPRRRLRGRESRR